MRLIDANNILRSIDVNGSVYDGMDGTIQRTHCFLPNYSHKNEMEENEE